MEKKTPARKTPANNAGSGADLLPPVPARAGERDLRNVADLFRRSGWFGEMTTAQLATLIVVGESLGLDAGQSVFDLTITPADEQTPAKVAYRESRTYEAAADRIDALRAANKPESGNKDVPGDTATPDPAVSECGTCHGQKEIVYKHPDGPDTTEPCPACSPAPVSNVVQLRPPPAAGDAEPGVTDPAAAGNAAGDVARSDEQDPAERDSWRGSIISMLRETGATEQAINDRLDKYDAADRAARETMLAECNRYYAKKVGDLRYSIVQRLAEDGKKTTEQQAGFYLYADVPTDPTEWNYAIAKKAADALDGFLKRK